MQQESGSFESEIEVCRNPFLFLPNNPECGGGEILESLFNLGHRVDNLKDPFRNSNLSCMYWSAVKGHEVSIEKG